MRPSVRRLEEEYQDQIDFHVLNIDDLSSLELMQKYQIAGIPTIVLLDAEGHVFRQLLGYLTEEELITAVEELLQE